MNSDDTAAQSQEPFKVTSNRNTQHKSCDSRMCSNASKRGKRFCTPCEDINASEERRARFYAGEPVSRRVWESIREIDVADAAFEAFKWALRAGMDEDTAVGTAERVADEVDALFRRARRAKDPQDRKDALALIEIGNDARFAGQVAAAEMIGRAAHAAGPVFPPRRLVAIPAGSATRLCSYGKVRRCYTVGEAMPSSRTPERPKVRVESHTCEPQAGTDNAVHSQTAGMDRSDDP